MESGVGQEAEQVSEVGVLDTGCFSGAPRRLTHPPPQTVVGASLHISYSPLLCHTPTGIWGFSDTQEHMGP